VFTRRLSLRPAILEAAQSRIGTPHVSATSRLGKRARCIVIAGPNGAGKTTFARDFLPTEAGVTHFVNADLIAGGLSPLKPEEANIAASRVFLAELDRLVHSKESFAFESTLSGISYAARLRRMKLSGYRIEIVYLKLRTTRLALFRIRARVKQGGHNVPKADVLRRFNRSWDNFEHIYRQLADCWSVYDNSGSEPILLERGP
jgi:predicted ABC-type ATPase